MRRSICRRATPRLHVPLSVVVVLLFAVAAEAAGDAIDVELTEAMFVRDRSAVSAACGGRSTVGCTVLTNLRMACSCSFEEAQWRIRWAIEGNAMQFVTTPQSIRHEGRHVQDLRSRLQSLASQLETARFDKESDCNRAVDRAMEVFPAALHDVVRKDVLQVDRKALEPSQIVAIH